MTDTTSSTSDSVFFRAIISRLQESPQQSFALGIPLFFWWVFTALYLKEGMLSVLIPLIHFLASSTIVYDALPGSFSKFGKSVRKYPLFILRAVKVSVWVGVLAFPVTTPICLFYIIDRFLPVDKIRKKLDKSIKLVMMALSVSLVWVIIWILSNNPFYLMLDDNNLDWFYRISLIVILFVGIVLIFLKSPVKPLTTSNSEWSSYRQSERSQFVDVHGHSAHIIHSIENSSAGVFGVTGVRGAGKSALTRDVLSKLQDHYFVLELTAPVRHDTDMGFFISVCRSVCHKVLDRLTVILHGEKPGYFSKQWSNLRKVLAGLLLIIAVGVPTFIWFYYHINDSEMTEREVVNEITKKQIKSLSKIVTHFSLLKTLSPIH